MVLVIVPTNENSYRRCVPGTSYNLELCSVLLVVFLVLHVAPRTSLDDLDHGPGTVSGLCFYHLTLVLVSTLELLMAPGCVPGFWYWYGTQRRPAGGCGE